MLRTIFILKWSSFFFQSLMPTLSAILKEKKKMVESKSDAPSKTSRASAYDNGDPDEVEPASKKKDVLEMGGAGEEHNSSDEEELADDADATETRKKSRQQDQDHEEGLSEDDLEMVKDLAKELDDELPDIDDPASTNTATAAAHSDDDGFEDDPDNPRSTLEVEQSRSEPNSRPATPTQLKSNDAKKRIQHVTNLLSGKATAVGMVDYAYDEEKSLWCELTLSFDIGKKSLDMSNVVKKAASAAVIKAVKNIKRAFVIKDEKGNPVLTTEGVNITEMFKKDQILDLKQLGCNNIHEVAK